MFNKPPYFKYGADAQFPDPDSSAAGLHLGENDASSIKSKPQHISYPLDSSGARRRLLAAESASRNGRRIKLHLKRKLQKRRKYKNPKKNGRKNKLASKEGKNENHEIDVEKPRKKQKIKPIFEWKIHWFRHRNRLIFNSQQVRDTIIKTCV